MRTGWRVSGRPLGSAAKSGPPSKSRCCVLFGSSDGPPPSSRLAVEAAPLSYKANSRRALAVVSLAMASTVSPLAAAIPSITSAT